MFRDETLESVVVESLWRKSQQATLQTKSCQTKEVVSAEASVQTALTADGHAQTELPDHDPPMSLHDSGEPDPPGLLDFLRRAEDTVVRELVQNANSHAFDGFQPDWEEQSQGVSLLHRLHHPAAQEQGLHVTSVDWNCTGAVLTCAYGRTDGGDWSTEKSCVCSWNLERRNLRSDQPDLLIDVPSAVTALSCHPSHPALIAGGLYNGDVIVWNSSRTQDPVQAQTGMSSDGHREPVYQVAWVPLQKKGELGLLSACSGGRVLLWLLDPDRSDLLLSAAYVLMKQQLPQSGSSSAPKARGGSSCVGVTSLALSPWDPDTFLTGSEGGLLLRCSFSARTPAAAAAAADGLSVAPRAPAVFGFRPHCGPVHSLHYSPHHRNLFVSAGTDGSAYVRSLLQTNPLLSLRVCDSYVFQVQWSPSRPLVLAAATGRGDVQMFDLARRSLRPAASLPVGAPAVCLSFNAERPELLAAGGTDGAVRVWRLGAELVEQQPRELAQLERIANQVAD